MNLALADLQDWLRHQQAWCDFRNCQRAGWRYTVQRWRWWPRILRTPPVPFPPPSPDARVELHTMCHPGDWLLMLWMLKSFQRHAGNPWPLVVHIQTPLRPSAVAHLRHHLPGARIILPAEAGETVPEELIRRGLPRCLHWRSRMGIMQKLFDVEVMASTPNIAFVDADVLFFRRPEVFLAAGSGPLETQYFQEDAADSYALSREEACEILGIVLGPRINTGITLRPRGALDLRQVEQLLAHRRLAWPSGHLEQTLHALCASAARQTAYLPPDYAIDMQSGRDPATMVCRHYAGASKRWVNREALRWLWDHGLRP